MQAWELRRTVLQRDLRAAVKDLTTALAERRAARAQPDPRRDAFRPLSEGEAEAIVGVELMARLATTMRRA